jgi:hypothetical protein
MTTAFNVSGNAALAASNVSANVALPTGDQTILVTNAGSVDAFLKMGATSGVTASTSGLYLGAGSQMTLAVGPNTYLAGVTASGSTTINIAQGVGVPALGG